MAAILFAGGIAIHGALPFYPRVELALLILIVVMIGFLRNRERTASAGLCIALIASGVLAGQLAASGFPSEHIGNFVSDEPRLAAMEIELADTPRLIAPEGSRHGDSRQVGRAFVRRVKTINGWEKAAGEISFSFTHADPPLLAGQRLRIVGMLGRPSEAVNPGEFDWRKQYRRQRVMATVRITRACDLEVIGGGRVSWPMDLREHVRSWLRAGYSQNQIVDRELLVALILGERGPAVQKIEDDFNTTGATHLLASSGLRVGILTFCLYLLCRLVRLRPRVSVAVVSVAVAGLGVVMLPSAQALRPVLACGAVAVALWLRRPVNAVQFLGLGALALLVIRPLDLYSAGFQLTFVVVFGLLVLVPATVRWLESRLRDPDVDVLQKFGRMTRRQRVWRYCWKKMVQLSVVGVVAWVVALPLVAYHFEQINPWSVFVGLLLLPVTLAALVMGFAKILLTMLLPWGAPAWAMLAVVPTWCLRHGIALCASLPGADIPTPSPSGFRVVCFYLLLVGACAMFWLPWGKLRLRWCAGCGLAGACGMSLFLPALVGFAGQSTPAGEVRITLLAVGAGQCAAVELPDGRIFFFDAGSSTLSDPLRTTIAPFLRHEGRSTVDGIYLSHGDFDHINAAGGIVMRYGVKEVVASPLLQKLSFESSTCRRLLVTLDHAHRLPRLVSAGDHVDLGSGVSAEVLWPPADSPFNSNNTGMVLRLRLGERSILFPADIQIPAESELLKHPQYLKADVLVAPHHGSSELTTDAFVKAVNPKIIVSSDDRRLTMKQRTFAKMVEGQPLYRTSNCGAIAIIIDRAGNLRVEPFLARSAPTTYVHPN